MPPFELTREQVTAFRLQNQNQHQRLPAGGISAAAGVCGLANTPPGNALASCAARVEGLAESSFQEALDIHKTLLQTWSLRSSPQVFPASELGVFTRELKPRTEQEQLDFIPGVQPGLEKSGLRLEQVTSLTRAAILYILNGRSICAKRNLDRELAAFARDQLSVQEQRAWDGSSPYGPDQTVGEALVSFCLRLAALEGLVCFAKRRDNVPCFTRLDQWLDKTSLEIDQAESSENLLKKYLRAYGPSTPAEFSAWAGMGRAQARRVWDQYPRKRVEVKVSSRIGWLDEEDWPAALDCPTARGVRLLPAHDPYLQTRDHTGLLPERSLHSQVWKMVGSPGVVLVDGEILGTWQAQRKGRQLSIRLTWFRSLPDDLSVSLKDEASRLASLRGCPDFNLVEPG